MFIGMPVHTNVHPSTMITIAKLLNKFGGEMGIIQGCPWVDVARADVLAQFLKSNSTELLWIDADIGLVTPTETVETMRAAKADVITCSYRKRKPPHEFCMRPVGGRLEIGAITARLVYTKRVIEIESDGLGCCLVQRRVIDQMIELNPQLIYINDAGEPRHLLFQHFITEGDRSLAGDDRAFFLRARYAGFKVECLIDAVVDHEGIRGCLAERLTAAG